MENATQALVIAGVVLIVILILTMGVNLVGKFGQTADSYNARLSASELQKYNSNFEVFVGREDITAQEIITLVNLTQQSHVSTTIRVDGINCTTALDDQDKKNEFLKKNILTYSIDDTGIRKEEGHYTCISVEYDSTNGKVVMVEFEEN